MWCDDAPLPFLPPSLPLSPASRSGTTTCCSSGTSRTYLHTVTFNTNMNTHVSAPFLPSVALRSFEKRYDNLPPADAHLQKISDHVSAYLAIVKGQLLATVPKAIVHCMVRHVY